MKKMKAILAQGVVRQDTSCCSRVCQVQFGLFVITRLFMGRNRKFVLEDDLQQVVWRTILRGPRPPSAKWDKPVPTTKPGVSKQAQPGSGKKPEVKTKQHGQTSTPPRVSLSPEEAMVVARSRVVKLRTVLATLGEDDEASTTIKAALQKAEAQAQERLVVEQIQSTQLFIAQKEKRVEQARQAVVRSGCARQSSCNPARAEALLADGVKRLTLQEKERTIPSPFSIPEPVVSGCAEISRLQSVIDILQKELASQWSTRAGHKSRRR